MVQELHKNRNNGSENVNVIFDEKAEQECYKRYKHIQYRNLIVKALLSFGLGVVFSLILKVLTI